MKRTRTSRWTRPMLRTREFVSVSGDVSFRLAWVPAADWTLLAEQQLVADDPPYRQAIWDREHTSLRKLKAVLSQLYAVQHTYIHMYICMYILVCRHEYRDMGLLNGLRISIRRSVLERLEIRQNHISTQNSRLLCAESAVAKREPSAA